MGDRLETPLTPYEPRHFRFISLGEADGLRWKLYTIRCEAAPMDSSDLETARAYLRDQLPTFAEQEGDHHGMAFAILHEGKDATWLLMHWWAHADILCQRIAHTNADGVFALTDRPFHGCVWEGVVVTHEHRAWVDTMLTDNPDSQRYLSTVLPDGTY